MPLHTVVHHVCSAELGSTPESLYSRLFNVVPGLLQYIWDFRSEDSYLVYPVLAVARDKVC